MSFRVYDNEKKCWVNDKVYLAPNDKLFIIKQSFFGLVKAPFVLSQDRYIYYRDIDLHDKNNILVYEGDYIKAQVAEDRIVSGIVVYARELSSYVILCFDCDEFFTLGTEICEYIEVIGNVCDGYYEDERDGQQTLQEQKI